MSHHSLKPLPRLIHNPIWTLAQHCADNWCTSISLDTCVLRKVSPLIIITPSVHHNSSDLLHLFKATIILTVPLCFPAHKNRPIPTFVSIRHMCQHFNFASDFPLFVSFAVSQRQKCTHTYLMEDRSLYWECPPSYKVSNYSHHFS